MFAVIELMSTFSGAKTNHVAVQAIFTMFVYVS